MIVGVDISTFAVHTAWLQDGRPCRWHCTLGTNKDHVIDRVRNVHMRWPLDVVEVAIEYPYSVSRETNAHLMAVIGAVTKSTPEICRVTWESSQRLRQAIGAPNKKTEARAVLRQFFPLASDKIHLDYWDADSIDALVACIGWTRILDAQETTDTMIGPPGRGANPGTRPTE